MDLRAADSYMCLGSPTFGWNQAFLWNIQGLDLWSLRRCTTGALAVVPLGPCFSARVSALSAAYSGNGGHCGDYG